MATAVHELIYARIVADDPAASDYFAAIKELVRGRSAAATDAERHQWQEGLDRVYRLLQAEILSNAAPPLSAVKFGTSGWRGLLGKDINVHSVASVTAAILTMYQDLEHDRKLREAAGVESFAEVRSRGCVLGFDNRFGGDLLAASAANVLAAAGVKVLYAGEATTGCLSASVLLTRAAFSINLTPSHNPLEYGGFKFNAADGGPAAPILTNRITVQAQAIIGQGHSPFLPAGLDLQRPLADTPAIFREDALRSWQQLVRANRQRHGIDYDATISAFAGSPELVVAVDCVHGAARNAIRDLFGRQAPDRLLLLRGEQDVTFGGIAPEPSSANMQPVMAALRRRPERLKLGAIIDPDGDRIRFTDGDIEISMNQFGAMAYHFLHEVKGLRGMVAKTVATSNLANAIAEALGEEVYEPPVGFKEFKPVIGRALVFFEESDGISVIGHTPEKDAFIGLLLALDMVLSQGKNLGAILQEIEQRYGAYYPERDGVAVSQQGQQLLASLAQLERYREGVKIMVGGQPREIRQVIAIDGRKMIFADNSWLMIRPSGTEPKVRFYVEARNRADTASLVAAAKSMLAEIGLLA
ncbi:MAG TPA: phosphoglucomutase [Desulfobulbaceae bacterium]|nr:phosphoglucomutase [Desulfobulbaceae bacterium]